MNLSTNQIIRERLKQKQIENRRKSFFRALISGVYGFFIFGIPFSGLAFSAYLAWRINSNQVLEAKSSASTIQKDKQPEVFGANDEKITVSIPDKEPVDQSIPALPKSKQLDIPLIKQIYPLSCEAASLEMGLKYFGISKTQDELLNEIGYASPKEITNVNGKLVWGDPSVGFVGDVKGWFNNSVNGKKSIKNATGYGVWNGPIAKTARNYLPGSMALDNATLDQVKIALSEEKPVIWWHRRDDIHREKVVFYTPTGKPITFEQFHVALISGYEEKSENNTVFTIQDPYFGTFQIDQESFLRYWNRHNNQIVILAKE